MTLAVPRARALRQRATPPEQVLWRALRNGALQGLKFRRQAPIGRYIVDFFCPAARLIVEVDGVTHVDLAMDCGRDRWLHAEGYQVLRLWNNDVMGNLDGVLATILLAAEARHPSLQPSPPRGEGCRHIGRRA